LVKFIEVGCGHGTMAVGIDEFFETEIECREVKTLTRCRSWSRA
jgi:hypothetical protein